jgi:trehalose 6-phosphate synthase
MRSLVAHYNVYRWAGRMLIDAAQLRRHERLTDRLADYMGLTGTHA